MEWSYFNNFEDLPVNTLYNILKLRQEVFIIEQDCIYDDIDDYDQKCSHLLLTNSSDIVSYARLVPKGVKYEEPSIGRIIVNPKYRGTGYGVDIVTTSIELLEEDGADAIRIEAQAYLTKFYRELGFVVDSDIYDLDGIPHLEMILTL